jgi:hypothetical protein
VLRISIEQNEGALSLVVEGRLVGPWVEELRKVSSEHVGLPTPLILDLSGLTAMDDAGHALLDGLRQRGATLLCSDVMNQYLVEQMARPAGDVQQACRPCRRFSSQSDLSAAAEDAFASSQAS